MYSKKRGLNIPACTLIAFGYYMMATFTTVDPPFTFSSISAITFAPFIALLFAFFITQKKNYKTMLLRMRSVIAIWIAASIICVGILLFVNQGFDFSESQSYEVSVVEKYEIVTKYNIINPYRAISVKLNIRDDYNFSIELKKSEWEKI